MQTISGQKNESQQVPDWYLLKLGRFGGSQNFRLMTEPRSAADKAAGSLSDGAMTYVYECVAEKITGKKAKEDFTSKYTDWGNENEPIAKAIYADVFNTPVTDVGYLTYSENAGGSPDGLVGDDGIIEIKCPLTITAHLEHKLLPVKDRPNHYWQCLTYLLITGRKWIDFVSYHPYYPGKHQLIRVRLTYAECEADILRLDAKIKKATEVLNQILKSL